MMGLSCVRMERTECVGLGCRRSDAAHAPRLASDSYGCPCPPTPRLRAPQAVVEKSRILRYLMMGLSCVRMERTECVGLGCRRSDAAHAPRLASERYYSLYPPTPRLRAPQAVVEKSRILRYPLLLRMLRAPQAVVEKSRILRYPLLLRMLRAPQAVVENLKKLKNEN